MNTNTYGAAAEAAATSATTLETWPRDRTWLKVSAGKVATAQMRQKGSPAGSPWPGTNGRAEEKTETCCKSFAVAAFVVAPTRRAGVSVRIWV